MTTNLLIKAIHFSKKYGNCLRTIKELMGLTKQIEYKNVVLKAKSNKKYSSVQNYHTLKFSKIPKNHLSFIKKNQQTNSTEPMPTAS